MHKASYAQCILDVNQNIPDTSTTNVFIEVSGLLVDSLNDPLQGVCGVEIEFRHSYLGDLQIELISPEGHSVILVGPFTTAINPTNLITWDVTFLPCGFPVSPDAGFNATWNNNQDWEVFATYTGSYYPQNGCLEDFDTGPANGLWQLRITDNDLFQTGQIISVSIIFCDNTGLSCTLCSADGGEFVQSDFVICEGEAPDISVLEINYPSETPDPVIYNYQYLITDGIEVFDFGTDPDFGNLAPGDYQVCGLSYNAADSADLADFLAQNTYDFIQQVLTGENLFCADLTGQCLLFEVLGPDTVYVNAEICEGGVYTVGGEEFDRTGQYFVHFQNQFGCDSIVALDLLVQDPVAVIANHGSISCTGTIMLDGSGSVGSGLGFTWTVLEGNIVTDPGQMVITVDEPGHYRLIVSSAGCADTAYTAVQTGPDGPFIYTEGGTVTCNDPAVQLNAVVFPTNVSYQWTGPGGFISNQLKPVVNEPGFYYLHAMDSLGCEQVSIVEVIDGTAPPVPLIQIRNVDCIGQTARFLAFPNRNDFAYEWSGPGGFSSSDRNVTVSLGGIYTLTITGPNGCQGIINLDFPGDYTLPTYSISVQDDTLNCDEQVFLEVMPSNPFDSVVWHTPYGDVLTTTGILVSQSGIYEIEIINDNGCIAEDAVEIINGPDLLAIEIFADTLDCNTDTANLFVVAPAIDSVHWSGPGLIASNGPQVSTENPGIFMATVYDSAGCIGYAFIQVINDDSSPNFQIHTDSIDCNISEVEIYFTTGDHYTDLEWMTPLGEIVGDSAFLYDLPGTYTLTLTGPNGCSRSKNAVVIADTASPVFFLESDNLGCMDSIPIDIVTVDSLVAYQWSGPNGLNDTGKVIFVSAPGEYTLTAVGNNGCLGNYTVQVDSAAIVPEISINGEQLNCMDPEITLQGVAFPGGLEMQWADTAGTILTQSSDLVVSEPGIYIFSAGGEDACTRTDSFEVQPLAFPSIDLISDSIDCYDPAELQASSDMQDVMYAWSGPGGFSSSDSIIITSESGNYTLTIIAPNGCVTDTSIFVPIDTLSPLAIAMGETLLRCDVTEADLDGNQSVGDSLRFSWYSPDGNIVTGVDTSLSVIDSPGTYILEVIQGTNGCSDTDTIIVVEEPNPLSQIFYTAISECFGDGMGSLTIDSVTGADTGLFYTLDTTGSQAFPHFSNLQSGTYELTIVDSFGCSLDTLIQIQDVTGSSFLDIGDDQEILLGDSVFLQVQTELDSSQIATIVWDPLPNITCPQCLEAVYIPTGTITIAIQLSMEAGCVLEDKLTISVNEQAKVFVPNIFSPNGDSVNDHLEVYFHKGVERIIRFWVFDRWGNLVYGVNDKPAVPGSVSWDGEFEGKKLNSAVFPYLLEVGLINGKTEILHGDITLIR